MSLSTAAPQRARPAWLAPLVLGVIAILWRLWYSLTRPITHIDELWFSLPTVRRMLAGDWLFFISGTNYGAPLQEALAAGLARSFGETLLTFRLPPLVFGGAAVAMLYVVLREVVKAPVALAIALLLACANSAVARYCAFAHSNYAVLLLLLALMQWMAFRTDRARTLGLWLALALLMGAASYSLGLALLQTGPLLLWLWLRSDFFQRFRDRLHDPAVRQRFLRASACAAAAALPLAAVLYRFLTRREIYTLGRLDAALLIAGLLLGLVALWLSSPACPAPRQREWFAPLIVAASLILVPLPAKLWFQRVEAPRLAARHVTLWAEARYSLRHLHEMPHQARLLIQGVFPPILIGRWDELEGVPTDPVRITWKSGVTAAFIALLAAAALVSWRRGWRPGMLGKDCVFIAPFIAVVVVMFPSWSLHSETCHRYLIPFLPGLYLLTYRILQEPIGRHPRLTCAALAALILYNGFDCYRHMI